jgi:uncharacterized membrane protein YsdA (DUF1294 family)
MVNMKHNPYKFYFTWWIILMIVSFIISIIALDLALIWNLFLATTLSSFLLFGIDKFQASQGRMRIPEKILYLSALCGGSAGTLAGMSLFRHKTRKTSFQLIIALILVVQIAGLAYLYSWSNG